MSVEGTGTPRPSSLIRVRLCGAIFDVERKEPPGPVSPHFRSWTHTRTCCALDIGHRGPHKPPWEVLK